jgi:hypothetical protein
MPITSHGILDRLRALSSITPHLWLTGGVAVDFLVGRWTRPHQDLDLVAFSPGRLVLQAELSARGFSLAQDGAWTTRWTAGAAGAAEADVEIVFVEPAEPRTGVLVIPAHDAAGGRAGRYPLSSGCLDPDRFGTLDGVSFRVCSAESEWLGRMTGGDLVPGRTMDPKTRHDLELLESLVPAARRYELLAQARRHQAER